jgi:hypothetical protein
LILDISGVEVGVRVGVNVVVGIGTGVSVGVGIGVAGWQAENRKTISAKSDLFHISSQ